MTETVVFGPADSGKGDRTITFEAYPGEHPVFSSAVEIGEWERLSEPHTSLAQAARGKVWVADVPQLHGKSWRFHTLYDAAGRLPRARSAGFVPLPGGKPNVLHFPMGRLRNWPNLNDIEVVIRPHHAWILNILPLQYVDERSQLARTTIRATYAMNELHFLKGTESCWVENVLEELDEPGEWVLNSAEQKLYLWPRGRSAPRGIMAPTLRELIRVEGSIDKKGPKDVPVRNLRFRGLTFMHGARYSLSDHDAGLQHDWEMYDQDHALVRLRGAEHCVIEECHFTQSGGGAIRVDLHGISNTITGNHIEHIGGTGILLCGYGPGTKDVNRKNSILNNHIHHTGELYWHSPGILAWQSGENRVSNNLIHNTPYSGIILSGCVTRFFQIHDGREIARTIRWHEVGGGPAKKTLDQVRPFLHTRDNLIEYNEIHHVMERLGDGNGIYIRGSGSGNVIRRNYIHDLVAPTPMQAAIRTDGGQRDTLITENLIYRCVAQGIILKLNNRCDNNIVADVIAPPRGYCLSLREGPMTGATIQRNILYSSNERCTFIDELPPGKGRKTEDRRGRQLARSTDAHTDYNIYFCAGDPELGRRMLLGQQRGGVDAHSMAVDPRFADPENGDFRLKPDSPALRMGFVPIDVSEIGLHDTSRSTSTKERND